MCSGKPGARPRISGSRIKAWPRIVAAGDYAAAGGRRGRVTGGRRTADGEKTIEEGGGSLRGASPSLAAVHGSCYSSPPHSSRAHAWLQPPNRTVSQWRLTSVSPRRLPANPARPGREQR